MLFLEKALPTIDRNGITSGVLTAALSLLPLSTESLHYSFILGCPGNLGSRHHDSFANVGSRVPDYREGETNAFLVAA